MQGEHAMVELANTEKVERIDADHIKDLISIFGAKSRVDGTSAETRQAYADCMLAIDAMFAVRGVV